MLIECLLQRDGGSRVIMPNPDGSESLYHFAPDAQTGKHVAEVADKTHSARFLSIVEGYSAVSSLRVERAGKQKTAQEDGAQVDELGKAGGQGDAA